MKKTVTINMDEYNEIIEFNETIKKGGAFVLTEENNKITERLYTNSDLNRYYNLQHSRFMSEINDLKGKIKELHTIIGEKFMEKNRKTDKYKIFYTIAEETFQTYGQGDFGSEYHIIPKDAYHNASIDFHPLFKTEQEAFDYKMTLPKTREYEIVILKLKD